MYKIYQSSTVGNTCILLFFCLFQVVEDKNTNENTEANDVRPKRVGIRHFKDYSIPYFIKTNHLDIIKLYIYLKMVLHIVRL